MTTWIRQTIQIQIIRIRTILIVAISRSGRTNPGMTNRPVNCRYFYGDYHRGMNKEACRLVDANPANEREWKRNLCNSCPVPALIIASNSRDLLLEAEVKRKFWRDQVEVTFAVCSKHMLELTDPNYCPECAKEQSYTASPIPS